MHELESTTAVEKGFFPQNIRQILAKSQGYSMIELIMVVVLISIVSVSVLPKFFDTSSITVAGAAEMVAADIRYAQELAMSSNQWKTATFAVNDTYYTVDSRTVNFPSNVSVKSGETFRFNSLGEPIDEFGDVITSGSTYVEIQTGSDCKKICVANYTGRASVVYPYTDPCP